MKIRELLESSAKVNNRTWYFERAVDKNTPQAIKFFTKVYDECETEGLPPYYITHSLQSNLNRWPAENYEAFIKLMKTIKLPQDTFMKAFEKEKGDVMRDILWFVKHIDKNRRDRVLSMIKNLEILGVKWPELATIKKSVEKETFPEEDDE